MQKGVTNLMMIHYATINSEYEMVVISSGDESDAEPMSTDMLENICDGSKFYPSVNRREAR